MSIQEATRRETAHIATGVAALTALENGVYALHRRWSGAVLLGSALGGAAAVVNFFLLALTVQKTAAAPDENRGKATLHLSYSLRMLGQLLVVILCVSLGRLPVLATALPLLFPRITIYAMQLMGMYQPEKQATDKGGDASI